MHATQELNILLQGLDPESLERDNDEGIDSIGDKVTELRKVGSRYPPSSLHSVAAWMTLLTLAAHVWDQI